MGFKSIAKPLKGLFNKKMQKKIDVPLFECNKKNGLRNHVNDTSRELGNLEKNRETNSNERKGRHLAPVQPRGILGSGDGSESLL